MGDFEVRVLYEPKDKAYLADIIFVHGLGGDALETWTHADGGLWPNWLALDMPRVRILSVNHPSSTFTSIFSGGGMGIVDRSKATLELLRTYDVGTHPIFFITHSLGGLISKALLRKAHDIGGSGYEDILDNVAGIVFLATPHLGAGLANALKILGVSSKVVDDLRKGSDHLQELLEWYVRRANERGIKTQAFFESKKTNGAIVVDEKSANPGTVDGFPVSVDANHINICKFKDKNVATYRMIRKFLQDRLASLDIDPSDSGLPDDLDFYTTAVDGDRKSLKEKLYDGGRADEYDFAKREKERIAKTLYRNATSSTARAKNKAFLGDIVSRFRLQVLPEISQNEDRGTVNQKLQEAVIDKLKQSSHKLANQEDIHAAIYYLTGNCHIAWGTGNDD